MIYTIIPAFNEEKRIGKVISLLNEARKLKLIDKIIVVSDGSKDKTAQVARDAGADKVIEYSKNRGKGYAVFAGLKEAKRGDVLLLDADLVNLTIDHIKTVITAAQKSEVSMAIGFLSDDIGQQLAPHLSGQRFIKRQFINKILEQRWEKSRFNIEILMNRLAGKLKCNTVMVPLAGLSHVRKEHKYSNYQALYHKFLFSYGLAKIYKHWAFWLSLSLAAIYLSLIILFPIKPHNENVAGLPAISKNDRILVIAAHPDDETLGAGGLMYNAVQEGAQVSVVVISAGDANKFSADVLDKTIDPSKNDFIEEGQLRLGESKTALLQLGVHNFYFLGFPDRGLKPILTKNWNTPLTSKFTGLDSDQYADTYKPGSPYQGTELLSQLEEIMQKEQPTILVTHLDVDTNPDHQSASKFSDMAVNELVSREEISKPKIYKFLIHWDISEYPTPLRRAENFPLNPPKDLINKYQWEKYSLSKTTQAQKRQALQSYRSQLKSPYLKALISAIDRTNELFVHAN